MIVLDTKIIEVECGPSRACIQRLFSCEATPTPDAVDACFAVLMQGTGFDSKAVSISVGNMGHIEQVRLVLHRQVKYLVVCMTLFCTLRVFQLTVIHNSGPQ